MVDPKVISAWKKRSIEYQDAIEGVLPKSFPRAVNYYLDIWMYRHIKPKIPNPRPKILDVGCGYGRLARKVLKSFPQARVFGVDVAAPYVHLFNRKLKPRGRALVAEAAKLPFSKETFDHAYMVTTLMYVLTKKEQKKVFQEIIRVLKPGGTFVVIERDPLGYSLVTLGGIVSRIRGKKFREISAVSFSPKEIKSLIDSTGGSLVSTRGMPVFTITLPGLILWGKVGLPGLKEFLEVVGFLDNPLSRLLTPSLYIVYNGQK